MFIIWLQLLGREGDGTLLQYSCLKNPMDGGAWWAAVYGVAQSQTRLKRLSSSSGSSKCMVDMNYHVGVQNSTYIILLF